MNDDLKEKDRREKDQLAELNKEKRTQIVPAGGVAGAGVGAAAGMTTCMFMGPFCLIAAPAIMQTGMGVGGGVG